MRYWQAWKKFFKEFRRDFHHTGSIAPSSAYLGRELAANLKGPREPAHILEVGPGTGSATVEIARRLVPGDQFDIVEINPHFAEVIAERVEREAVFAPHREAIHIHNMPVEELPENGQYQHIVSGLPLNNFPVDLVRTIFGVFERLSAPGGTLAFFEYLAIRQLKSPFVSKTERDRLAKVGGIIEHYVQRCQFRQGNVFINLPPAAVHHLRLRATKGETK